MVMLPPVGIASRALTAKLRMTSSSSPGSRSGDVGAGWQGMSTDDRRAEQNNAAAIEADPLSDLMGSADYRREMIRVWVRRLLLSLR